MVDENGLTRTDTRRNHARNTDEKADENEDVDAVHTGSSDTEQPQQEFPEGGYGW